MKTNRTNRKLQKLETKERKNKIKPMKLSTKIISTLFVIIIGYGFFFVLVWSIITALNNEDIPNNFILIYLMIYYLILIIPSKFTWETIYIHYGKIKLTKKWLIMSLLIIFSSIIPIYHILALLDIWYYKKTKPSGIV